MLIVFQIHDSCNTTAQLPIPLNKRSLNEQSEVKPIVKRTISIPDVGLNLSLFERLESKFISLDGDVIATG